MTLREASRRLISPLGSAVIGFAWGFAEGLFLFIVPDVFITLATLFSPRRGGLAWATSVVGSVLAVCAAYAIAAHDPKGYRAFLIAQPGITEELARHVEGTVKETGLPVTPLLVLGGVPLKLYAFSAFSAGVALLPVLAWTLFARFVRILPSYLLFILIGRTFRGSVAAHPGAWLGLCLGAWALFYCFYLAKMGW